MLVRELDPICPKLRTLVAQPNKINTHTHTHTPQNKQLKIITGKGEGAGVLPISSCKLTIPWLVKLLCVQTDNLNKRSWQTVMLGIGLEHSGRV